MRQYARLTYLLIVVWMQVRVQNDSCIVADDFADVIQECYDAYYEGVEDKKPYGVKNGTA